MSLSKLLISTLLLTVLLSPTQASENFTNFDQSANGQQWEQVAEYWRAKWLKEFAEADIKYDGGKIPLRINFVNQGCSGVTQYNLKDNQIADMTVTVTGNANDLQYSVIPHEIMHTVFAYYYKKEPLPRWANEGYCTFIEPKQKLMPWKQVYPFKDIMNMQEYPKDVDSFYAQSTSMVAWLVSLKGKIVFRDFIHDYMYTQGDWPVFLDKYYGFKTYEDAQSAYMAWYHGSKEITKEK